MATSLDALEALLQFREGASMKRRSPIQSYNMPVPNPLDPSQPHLIEGDAPASVVRQQVFGGAKSAFSPKQTTCAPVVTVTVPNPLATSQHRQPLPPPVSFVEALTPSSSRDKPVAHGFAISPDSAEAPMSCNIKPSHALEVEVRTEKIRDALNSKPQRGKKRQNLNELERLELTRTRNREHAKSTRMKKKARLQELMDIEKKYLLLKEKETLELCRRQSLNEFVETSGNRTVQQESSSCPHSTSLIKQASALIQNPQFSVTESVALTSENSGMVKVSAHGTDLESGSPKTLLGVICVDFTRGTANISAASLFWSSPKSNPSSGGMFPSISVLSFES